MKKTVLLGVTSGIAAFKSLELIKLLKKGGLNVVVVMTNHATKMLSKKEFEKASDNKVYTDLFEKDFDYKTVLKRRKVDHIELADNADVVAIVPATANVVAKLAHGMADDFLTTTILATRAPIIVAPAMNVNMWHNEAVRGNIATLQQRGIEVVHPAWGMLACGYEGEGRLEELSIIKDAIIERISQRQSLKGKKIIVTSGGTIEKIDNVRYIANRSSGKMGAALARECARRGAQVLLLQAKNAEDPRIHLQQKTFQTADELELLVRQCVPKYEVIFHTAAVSDFEVVQRSGGKLSSDKKHRLELSPRKKILDSIKKLNPKITLIAFKAEHEKSAKKLIEAGYKRLKESKADFMVINDISRSDRGFEAENNEVYMINRQSKSTKFALATKKEIAKKIVDHVFLT